MVTAIAALCLFALATPAAAKEVRLPLPHLGSFVAPMNLAVGGDHDVYAIDGRSEGQKVTISATAGKFRLKYEGKTSKELKFDAKEEEVSDALREIACPGTGCVSVPSGKGDATGSNPYIVNFAGSLNTTDVGQVECAAGSPPLTGGSGCSATTITNGVNGSVSRYHADGTPDPFSALGSNAVDGLGPGPDLTPQGGLHFFTPTLGQIAVDESGGATDGEVYAVQPITAPPFERLLDVFAPTGEYLGQLTQYEETPGNPATLKPLGIVCGVAVDATGDVYLADNSNGIHKYDPSTRVVANDDNVANFTTVTQPCGLAAGRGPTAGSLFAVSFSGGKLFKLDASNGEVKYGGKPISEGNATITVDPTSGRLLAAYGAEVQEWDASGESAPTLLSSIEAGSAVTGIGVDGATGKGGTVYVVREKVSHLDVYGPILIVPDVTTEAAAAIGLAAATLHGTISAAAGPEAHCHFQYLTDAAYQANVKAAEEESKVEPKTEAEIAEAAFAGAQSAPCSPAGPFTGVSLNSVSANVEGLAHETAYRFRLVGESEEGQVAAEEALFFETFGKPKVKGGSASEVTTTAAKISGEVNPGGQATSFAVQYVSEAEFLKSGYNGATSIPEPAEDLGSGTAFLAVSVQLSDLTPDTAYRFRLVATNADGMTLGKEGSFATFAPPSGLLDGRAWELVSPAQRMGEVYPPEPFWYGGGSCRSCVPSFTASRAPMQSSPDGDAVAYEGDPFASGLAPESNSYVARRGAGGWQSAALSEAQFEAQVFKAFSPDLSKAVLLQAEPSLTPQAPPGYADLYLREEGKGLTTLITAKPPNRPPGGKNSSFHIDYAAANLGTEAVEALSHVIFQANDALTEAIPGIAPKAPTVSAEETDLYEWSGGQLRLVNVLPGDEKATANATIGSGHLLAALNENFDFDHAISDDGRRVFWSTQPSGQVYVREAGAATIKVPDPGRFLTASADGAKVLLSDGKVYDLEAESLTDLTGGAGGFQGMAGASEDLSRIYFVDTEALTPPEVENANPAGPEHAEKGRFNLYLWEEGALSFIGRLAASDNYHGSEPVGVWRSTAANRLAQASADGRFLAFRSTAPLTGYDNTVRKVKGCIADGSVGSPACSEVFEYDAAKGTLTCASCNPSGVRPLGGSFLSLIVSTGEFFPQPANLPPEGEGRLFFESLDALTPADDNGRIQDVYEFEPNGVGSCERTKGCLSLISSGHDPVDSQFVNASASGDDVFFATRAQLVPTDLNEFVDIYDARVGGGFEEPPLPVPCEGEACKGPVPATPEEPGAGSSTLQVEEPPPPRRCVKGKVRRHGKCLKRPRRHRHAHRNRGGSR